jgi:TrpR-related protein YerC/YecD
MEEKCKNNFTSKSLRVMTKNNKNLKKEEVGKMFYKLCLAISKIKKPTEVSVFLGDLLTANEVAMISKRLKIAEMILDGFSYEEIIENLKVGSSTVARVQEWLNISGDGYRQAVEDTRGKDIIKESDKDRNNFSNIKKKYPMYYWPEIVLENIIKNSNKRQKEEIKKVIDQMDKLKEKTDLYKKLKRLTKFL